VPAQAAPARRPPRAAPESLVHHLQRVEPIPSPLKGAATMIRIRAHRGATRASSATGSRAASSPAAALTITAATAGLLAWRTLRRRRRADLTGQVVLITGGSRGLGLVLAREFARHGCRIAICARDAEQLHHAHADLEARGAEVFARICDISDPAQVQELVLETTTHLGPIDILVNNAGTIQVGPLESLTLQDFEDAMATIFWGSLHTTLAVLPEMRARRHGRIVNITSIGARVAVPHLLPYDAAKFALRGLSEGLHAELAKDDVVVTTILPGLMRTGSPVNALFKGQQAKEFTWFSLGDATPLTAMSAERAARRIVLATRRGETEVTLTWQAKLLGLAHGLFPSATIELLGLMNRLLPSGDGGDARIARETRRGMDLATTWSPSPLTALMNRAARENNQFGGRPEPAPEHARKVGVKEPPTPPPT
jgi:NAD(P)-dependent dehydrogenase (short-subunit alcohol dehydrogenase family)